MLKFDDFDLDIQNTKIETNAVAPMSFTFVFCSQGCPSRPCLSSQTNCTCFGCGEQPPTYSIEICPDSL